MRKVTFENKVENLGTTYTGKAWAADFNEIKEVVNENADITTITMAVSADLVGNTLYFKNYLGQIIYQVDVSSILTSLGLVDLNDVEFTMPLGEGHAPVFSQLVNKFVNKKVSLDGHNHDSLYSPIDHNHNSLYAPLSHSNITSGNPHGVSYSNILGDVPFYTKSESDLKYHIKGGSYTEDFLAQTISSKKSITETLIIPTGNPLLSPGEWALTMTDNGWGGEPPIGGTVGFLDDLADVTLVAPIGDLQVLGRSSGQWANINLTIGHISGLSTSLGNVYTKAQSDARYPILSYGLIPSSYLPSYVDDIIEVSTFSTLPAVGETGKIYVTLDTNLTYRWSGSGYTEISKSLALGETDSTAYRGDRGKIAYDHSLIVSGNPHGVSYSNITGTAPFYTKIESDANYHPKYGSDLLDFTAKKLKSKTLIIPTNASPELSVGEWALVMTNNGWGGEAPIGGTVGFLDDLIDVSLSSPVVNQFLFHNGTSWINSYLTSLLVTTALGYTPYNSTNPSGYISAITGTMVQAVLTGEITSHYHDGRYYTESEINNFFSGVTAISGYNKSNWDTAYSWGNHALAGYALSSTLTSHINNTSNPHSVTFSQLGGKPTTLSGYGITDAQANITAGGTDDYYAGDKSMKSLSSAVGAVVLTGLSVATSAVISSTDSVLGALGKLQAQITTHIGRTDNPHSVTKSQVGLENVDNTSDANKPVSSATQTALNAKVNTTTKVAGKELSADVAISLYDLVDVSAGDTVILSGGGANGYIEEFYISTIYLPTIGKENVLYIVGDSDLNREIFIYENGQYKQITGIITT